MGYIFNVLASVCWGLMGVFSVKATKGIHPVVAAFVSTVTGVLLLLAVVAMLGQIQVIPGIGQSVLALLALAGVTEYGVGRTMMFFSMRNVGAARTAPIANTSILLAPLLAAFMMNEAPSPKIFLGLLCAFIGSFLIARGQR